MDGRWFPHAEPRTFDVVAVGNAVVDVISHADDSFLERHGMVKGTMRLIPDEETAEALYAEMGPAVEISGGSAANTVVGVASLGGRAAFIGRVADDQLGEVFTHDIRAAGVEYRTPPVRGSGSTGRCMVLITPDAQRTMNTYLGVANRLRAEDIDEDLITAAKVLYCEGYLWDLPDAKNALVHAMKVAKGGGARVAFTLSDPFCVDRHREELLDLVEGPVDVLFANEAEICSLYGVPDVQAAAEKVAGVCEVACLTMSERGSLVVTDGSTVHVEAAHVDRVVDTTGAGDLYAAGFLYGFCRSLDLERCARVGSVAAAEVISHTGARPEADLRQLVAPIVG